MDAATNNMACGSLKTAWQHFRQMLSSSSLGDAWQAFKKAVESLPAWSLVVVVVIAALLVVNSSLVIVPLGILGFFAVTYFTVKRAVLAALREYDRSGSD